MTAVTSGPVFAVVAQLVAASLNAGVLGLVVVMLPAAPPKPKVVVVVVPDAASKTGVAVGTAVVTLMVLPEPGVEVSCGRFLIAGGQ